MGWDVFCNFILCHVMFITIMFALPLFVFYVCDCKVVGKLVRLFDIV